MGNDSGPHGSADSNGTERTGLSRRRYLGLQAAVLAGVGTGTAAGAPTTGASGDDASVSNTVSLSPDDRVEESVSEGLFGRLAEHYESGTI
jgi:hypothetical protein